MHLRLILSAAIFATACHDDARTDLPGTCGESFKDVPIEINRDLDILFVIDNSSSMGEEQTSLTTNFGRFINVLANIEGGLPNIHIGVVSTDVGAGGFTDRNCAGTGDNGTLQMAPRIDGCNAPSDRFISDTALADGTRTRNYSGSLVDSFSCIASLGTSGCGFEQPLESLRRALDGTNSANQGFLRDDAFLLVIIITDEDDCSASDAEVFNPNNASVGPASSFRCFEHGIVCDPDEPRIAGGKSNCRPRESSPYIRGVDEYVEFLRGLKSDPSLVVVSAIIGNPEPVTVSIDSTGNPALDPSCQSSFGAAAPAIRIADFVESFPQRGTLQTICNNDLSGALDLIAQPLTRLIGAPCIEGDIDLDREAPGVQHECVASDIRFPNTDRQEETLLAQCSSATPDPSEFPCWNIAVDAVQCSHTTTNAAFEVHRGAVTIPTGTHMIVRCSLGCEAPVP